jgi:hypothetical protein
MKRESRSHHHDIEESHMTRKSRILAVAILVLGLPFSLSVAQAQADPISLPSIVANPTAKVITFKAAAVGISSTSAQKIVASFKVSGYSGSFTPTAAMHYGHDYSLGAVTCSGGSSSETCKVTITFIPTLPGARKDALLLLDGTTTLATVLVGGIGQSPLSLIQPGVVTSPVASAIAYIYQSVVDENGTVYFLNEIGDAVYSYTKAGVLTELPITGLVNPSGIAIDGAGTLYIAQNTFGTEIVTYTAAGVQGTITVVPPPPYSACSSFEYLISVAFDQSGNLFVVEYECQQIFELKANGTYVTNAIDPAITQPFNISVDANDNVFVSGYQINKLTPAGVQTQINTVGAGEGDPVDAAGTIYATRYTGGGVAELPATAYSTSIMNLDPGASPLGDSVASDGTVYVGNYYDLDKVDRTQGSIAFGEQFVGVISPVENVSVYNGGNKALTLSEFALTGSTAFALQTATTKPCTKGLVIAKGSYCQVAVTMTAPNAGTFNGTITFTTNSLNTTSTEQTVALSGFVYGVYMTASPTSLSFGSQVVGTSSPPKSDTLTNQGDLYSALIGTPVSSSPAFQVGLGSCNVAVPVGSSCKLTVTFHPSAVQAYSGTVTVPVTSTGGGTTPSVTFNVSGTGIN